MMGQSMNSVPGLLALVVGASLCCRLSAYPNEQHSDEIILDREEVFVKLEEDGSTFSIMIEPEDLMFDLFVDIENYEGFPRDAMKLQIGNTKLNFSGKLSDHNIKGGSIVNLSIPETRLRYSSHLNVMKRDGRYLPVVTKLGETVASLKENITQWAGISHLEQRILLNGKELKDERKLAHYCIYYGNTLNLGGPLEECRREVTLFVKALNSAILPIQVNLADTVDSLKAKIFEKAGVPGGVQRLFANERLITGEDHLCDLGLDDGSSVYMFLYSSRVTSLDQVARLKEARPVAHSIDPLRGPIFREVEDDLGEQVEIARRHRVSLYKDAANWLIRGRQRPDWHNDLFETIALLSQYSVNEVTIQRWTREIASRSNASRLDDSLKKLYLAVWPYRLAANLTSENQSRQKPGITLGGSGFTDVSLNHQVSLGADINNWAPDAFTDSSLMRLFRVAERVRVLLERSNTTGEGILSIPSQRRMNNAILSKYLEGLAGLLTVEYNEAGDGEECAICRYELLVEPSLKLPCDHTYHADCLLSWVSFTRLLPRCPYCQRAFSFSNEGFGEADLEAPEMQDKNDH